MLNSETLTTNWQTPQQFLYEKLLLSWYKIFMKLCASTPLGKASKWPNCVLLAVVSFIHCSEWSGFISSHSNVILLAFRQNSQNFAKYESLIWNHILMIINEFIACSACYSCSALKLWLRQMERSRFIFLKVNLVRQVENPPSCHFQPHTIEPSTRDSLR